MPLGYLASLVATMPAWIVSMVDQDQLDLKSPGAAKFKPLEWKSRSELIGGFRRSTCRGTRSIAEHYG